MNRIGFGYDVHKLIPGRKLILGGEDIPSEKGLLGHSDADILLHAIADALLGAASLGDIGKHFPDSDQQFKGISSLVLLERVAKLISDHHYEIDQMKSNIAAALHLDASKISIKATTNEGLGFIGAGDGAVAYAIALINSVS